VSRPLRCGSGRRGIGKDVTARRNTTDRLLAKLREDEVVGYGLAAVQSYASGVLRDWYPHPRCVLMRFEVETLDLRANDLEAAARLPLVTAEVLAQAKAAAEGSLAAAEERLAAVGGPPSPIPCPGGARQARSG
jgi:hypothetical protein